MILNTDGMKPIYAQISEWLEREILSGSFSPDEKVPSQYQLADMFNINPATAAKGLNLLADENILYKKRGLGMFVSPNGRDLVLKKRKNIKLKNMIMELVIEAEGLGVSREELIRMIKTYEIPKEGEGS
ncbi:MAG: GntR family transcriptional regulator [Dehalobacterium sp.]